MPSKRKTRKINESVASINKNVKKSASKLNVKKDVASAVKNQNTYKKDPRTYHVKDKDSYKGRNKSEVALENSVKRVGGMKSKMIGYNPYHSGNKKLHQDMAKYGQKMHEETNYNMKKTMKKQANAMPTMPTRDTPLPKTSDKYFKK